MCAHVWKWCKRFEGRTDIHDEERSGRPSIISKELVDVVKEIVKNHGCIMIANLCKTFTLTEVLKGTRVAM